VSECYKHPAPLALRSENGDSHDLLFAHSSLKWEITMNQIKRIIHSTMGKALVFCAFALTLLGSIEATFDYRVSGKTEQQICPRRDVLTITPIVYPNAVATAALGINNPGHVVGSYRDKFGNTHGFLLVGSTYTPIDFPGDTVTLTAAHSINNHGHIAGEFIDDQGNHGFVLVNGSFKQIDISGFQSQARGINDRGEIVGNFLDNEGLIRGYLLVNGMVTRIDFPGAVPRTLEDAGGVPPIGINDLGQIVGEFQDARKLIHGYLRNNGVFTQIDVPCAPSNSITGINDLGQFVGSFGVTGAAEQFGYLFDGRIFIQIGVPDATITVPFGINDLGRIVGIFGDGQGNARGFVGSL
jgi:uncharacterized membrane protein